MCVESHASSSSQPYIGCCLQVSSVVNGMSTRHNYHHGRPPCYATRMRLVNMYSMHACIYKPDINCLSQLSLALAVTGHFFTLCERRAPTQLHLAHGSAHATCAASPTSTMRQGHHSVLIGHLAWMRASRSVGWVDGCL